MLHHRPAPPPNSRRRLIALLIGVTGLSLILLSGLLLTVLHSSLLSSTRRADPDPSDHTVTAPGRPGPVSAAVARARDELAARPMPDTGTGREYGYPQVSTRDPGEPLVLPTGRGPDGLGVETGYPRTPEGALAQLGSIDVAALQSGSLPGVRAVIRAWAAPGGPTAQSWSGVDAMADLLAGRGLSGAGSAALSIRVTPAMGLIKGVVGDDFSVVCVDFSIDVSLATTSHNAVVDCQRMLWQDGRWVIGPGREPAPAVSVWPDTDAAFEAGYRDLSQT